MRSSRRASMRRAAGPRDRSYPSATGTSMASRITGVHTPKWRRAGRTTAAASSPRTASVSGGKDDSSKEARRGAFSSRMDGAGSAGARASPAGAALERHGDEVPLLVPVDELEEGVDTGLDGLFSHGEGEFHFGLVDPVLLQIENLFVLA